MKPTLSFILVVTVLLYLLPANNPVRAQTADAGHTRYRFAEMYLGLDVRHIPEAGQAFYNATPAGATQPFRVEPRTSPRFLIGGTHFWGHADFFINVPVTTLRHSEASGFTSSYDPGIETGASIYPWALTPDKIRPYAGFSWSALRYQQTVRDDRDGPSFSRSRITLKAGLSLRNKLGLWEIGASYLINPSFSYPLSRTQFESVTLPRWNFSIAYKYLFDTTHSGPENGRMPERIERFRKQGKLNTFSVSLGVSNAFTLSSSPYNQQNRPYLEDPVPAEIFPDLSVGYHLFGLDAALDLSFRSVRQSQEAFDVSQALTRRSVALELFKFLGDYHGFVPFAGPFISREYLSVGETDRGRMVLDQSRSGFTAGVVFGWDIRPFRTPAMILRTKLRYAPWLSISLPDQPDIRFNQLEVNFIQLVVYPRRLF